MATPSPRKFSFNDFFDFEQDAANRAQSAQAQAAATYSELELAEARSRGYAEGQADAAAEMETTGASRQVSAAERIAEGIAALTEAETERTRAFRKAAFEVAVAALRKIMPDLSRRFGQTEIEIAIGEILREQMEESRIVVRVADATFDELSGQIDALAVRHGYTGKMILLAGAGLGPSDLQVEWADGGADRSVERTLSDITGAIARLTDTNSTR